MNRCAVLGDPISHSLSPALHRAAYAELGLDWTYEAVRVPAGGLGEFLDSLDPTWRGLSLTMPLKRELLPLADDVSEVARAAGAANTLVLTERHRSAYNTDVPGAAAALRERGVDHVEAASILGGGATATSAGLALADLGCRRITVLVRDESRAGATLQAVAAHRSAPTVTCAPLDAPGPVSGEVVISTIPASAQSLSLIGRCAEAEVLFDVIYDPWPTPLASAGTAAGQVVVSGLDLLAHQAVLQVELFTGHAVPVEVLRSAGRAAMAG